METVLISLVSIALVIVGTVTMTLSAFTSAAEIADSVREMELVAADMRRTEIACSPPASYSGGLIDLTVSNDGQTDLGTMSRWDVIAEYQTGGAVYLAYSSSYPPGNDQWAVEGLYLSDNLSVSEVFDNNILNPGETMKMSVSLSPEIGPGETGRIAVSTPNGVTSQCLVTRQ